MRPSLTVWLILLLVMLALANVSPTSASIWGFDGAELLPLENSDGFISPTVLSPTQNITLAGQEYCLKNEDEKLTIFACNPQLDAPSWHSPDEWQVKEAFFSDLNRDGENEATLLVWRPFKPWPVDQFMPHGGRIASFQNEEGMSCHLILIGLVNGEFRELWAGSSLADPIHSLQAVDLDGDGYQELAALEYPYDGKPSQSAITIWAWNGFGFSLSDRQDGTYASLLVKQSDIRNMLLAQ